MRDSEGGRIAIATNLRGRHGMGGRRDGSEVAANVRLIAAAPDMLEALQRAREVIADFLSFTGGCDHDVGMCQCPEQGVLEKIDAAISKATT